MSKTKNERGDITTNTMNIKNIDYYKQLHTNKQDNLGTADNTVFLLIISNIRALKS